MCIRDSDIAADFVVEGAGGADGAGEDFEAGVVHGGVAEADALLGLGAVAGANVDPDFVDLGELFALLAVHQVDGALAGDALDDAVLGEDADAAAGEDGAVVTAEGVKIKEAVLVNMFDDEAEFIHVAGEQEGGVCLLYTSRCV